MTFTIARTRLAENLGQHSYGVQHVITYSNHLISFIAQISNMLHVYQLLLVKIPLKDIAALLILFIENHIIVSPTTATADIVTYCKYRQKENNGFYIMQRYQ